MGKNVVLNRISNRVHVFNMDGREFVRLLLATPGGPIDRVEDLQQGDYSSVRDLAGVSVSALSHRLPPVPASYSPPPEGVMFQHAVMNLPASAVEFLDAFNGAFDPGRWRGRLPKVHVYTFKKGNETDEGDLNSDVTIHNLPGCM